MVEERTLGEPVLLWGEIAFHDRRISAYEGELRRIGRLVESTGRSIQGFQLGIDWGTLQDAVARAQSLLSQLADEVIVRSTKAKQVASLEQES